MTGKNTQTADIATLQANVANITSTILDVKKWLIDSSDKREERHLELITRLTKIESNQQDFVNYQDRCEIDRQELAARMTECETTQKIHKRVGALAFSFFAAIGSYLEVFKH